MLSKFLYVHENIPDDIDALSEENYDVSDGDNSEENDIAKDLARRVAALNLQ